MSTKQFGFESQTYTAPHAESVEINNEGLLLNASIETTSKGTESIDLTNILTGSWDEPVSPSAESVEELTVENGGW